MGSKDGPQLKASLRYGAGATWSSSCSSSAVWPEVKEDKKKPAARARRPKRTSFACLECSKTFPTQQAMAGHCSAHTRAGARRVPVVRLGGHLPPTTPVAVVAAPSNPLPQPPHHYHHHSVNAVQYWTPQVAPRTNPMPPLAIRYVPYARPASNSNQMVVRLPYLDPHGRRGGRRLATNDPATNPAFRPAAWPIPMPTVPASGRLGWRAFVPLYGAPPPFGVNVAPPSDAASSTDRPGRRLAADLTLRVGSGRDHAHKRTTLPLLRSLVASDGQQSDGRKCKLVNTDGGGDRGSNGGKDQIQMGGLDLELRLCR
uniref:Uncharacterized protein n=1 Tax=Avena sativa TaxID=4498 RepID=A0ACD5VAD5_AVESA